MNKLDVMGNQQFIFGSLFVVANKIDTLLERELNQFDMTTKQWFLSIIIGSLFTSPPTIKEAAKAMGSSHQNVKQVALKLEKKGFMKLERDVKDARATRLILTEQSNSFWAQTQDKGVQFTQAIFKGIDEEQLSVARAVIEKIWANLEELEDEKSK